MTTLAKRQPDTEPIHHTPNSGIPNTFQHLANHPDTTPTDPSLPNAS
jgi:hypothetical protein